MVSHSIQLDSKLMSILDARDLTSFCWTLSTSSHTSCARGKAWDEEVLANRQSPAAAAHPGGTLWGFDRGSVTQVSDTIVFSQQEVGLLMA